MGWMVIKYCINRNTLLRLDRNWPFLLNGFVRSEETACPDFRGSKLCRQLENLKKNELVNNLKRVN